MGEFSSRVMVQPEIVKGRYSRLSMRLEKYSHFRTAKHEEPVCQSVAANAGDLRILREIIKSNWTLGARLS